MRLLEILLMTLAGFWQGLRQDLNLLELAAIAVALWAFAKRNWRPDYRWNFLPRRPALAALCIALGAILIRLALLPLMPVPVPIITDEFSHLLLADTFLHGHLANPTHAFWPHFESIHIVQQPHYASNYFPGQAVFLAAGILLAHSAWAAVLAECALFLITLYWALRGWVPVRWALFGTLLAALRFAIASYWVNAYHGGFLPALGGALIAGAFQRLRKKSSLLDGTLLALGLALLASTRPFEGLLYSLPFMGISLWQARRHFKTMMAILVPVTIIVGLTLFGLGTYFHAVTGSPFQTTYQMSYLHNGWPLPFPWSPVRAVQHRNIEMQRYYEYEMGEHERVSQPLDSLEYLTFRAQEYWRFFLGPLLSIPLIMLRRALKRRPMLWICISGGLAAILLEGATPHYLAPATVMVILILVECCRYLNASHWFRIVPMLPAGLAVVLVIRMVAQGTHLPYTQKLNYQSWCCRVEGNLRKAQISEELASKPGDHLVFVKSKTDENNLYQWIYNSADIDHQRIIWARDLGDQRNAELVQYYAAHNLAKNIWMVDPNVEPAPYAPYVVNQKTLRQKLVLQSQMQPPLPNHQ